jgi:serine/threonine-protein kinase
VLDIHPDGEPPYLVMEYVDGVSLQAAVARAGPFTAGAAAFCGRQAALGLQRIASAGLVHRDVKPANLLVDRLGLVKILDLGIVRVEGEESLTLIDPARGVLGTADYLSPEQAADSSRVDARADLYALGGTLYFLLAGHPPFPDGTSADKLALKAVADPPRIDRLRPDIPAALADVVHRLLARDPAGRYPTPLAAAEALTPFADPGPNFPAPLFAVRPRTTVMDMEGMATPILLTPGDLRPAAPTVRLDLAPRAGPDRRRWLPLWLAIGTGLVAAAAYGLCELIRP